MTAAQGSTLHLQQPRSAEPAPVTVARHEAQASVRCREEEVMGRAAAGESAALSDATLSVSPTRADVEVGDSTAESQPLPATATPGATAATPPLQATQK
jgi:hypothetical protein